MENERLIPRSHSLDDEAKLSDLLRIFKRIKNSDLRNYKVLEYVEEVQEIKITLKK